MASHLLGVARAADPSVEAQPHEVQFLEHPGGSLGKYLDVIDRAQSSVDMEYFIFNPCGSTGRLVINALAEKVRVARAAGRPFRARFLIDDFNFFRWTDIPREAFTAEMAELGIDVKIYNPIHTRVQRGNQRNHRKLLVADGLEAITGGRNIDDDYFGLSRGLNYVDHDLRVRGPITGAMQSSFNDFWNSSLSELPNGARIDAFGQSVQPDPLAMTAERQRVRSCIRPQAEDAQLRERLRIESARLDQSNPVVSCPSMAFASDAPHGSTWFVGRQTAGLVRGALERAEHSVVMENYNFVPNVEVARVLTSLKRRHIETDIVTNGYQTEPQQYLSLLQHNRAIDWADDHFRIHSLSTPSAGDQSWYYQNSNTMWSIHAKSFVIDSRSTVVGSMNLDPRSVETNTEDALYAENCPLLASQVERSIRGLAARGSAVVARDSAYSRCFQDSRIDPSRSGTTNTIENMADGVAAWLLSDHY